MSEQKQLQEDRGIDFSAFLTDFVRSIFRFWWVLPMLAFVFGAISFVRAERSFYPLYRSESTFTVTTGSTGSALDTTYDFYYDSTSAQQLSRTFPSILSSELLTDAIKRDLDTEVIAGSISAETLENSNMVTMTVEGSDPDEVKRILESVIRVYPEVAQFVIGKVKFNMIDPPNRPAAPCNTPRYFRTVVIGSAAGLIFGLLCLLVYAFFRRTIHKEGEIQEKLNVSCLVSLPLENRKERKKNTDRLVCIGNKETSPWFDEGIKALWMRVESALAKSQKKILLVTSTLDEEGKTTVAVNLAFRIAQNDKRVILVDADCRNQKLGKKLGFPAQNLEKDAVSASDPTHLLHRDQEHRIRFLGGSVAMRNVSRFLSVTLKNILQELSEQADYIIIDAPAAAGFEDALLIREYADAVLFVVKQDCAPKQQVIDTIAGFDSEDAPVIGYAFNGVAGVLGEYGYGRYGYSKYGYTKYGYGKYGYGKYGYGAYGYGKYGEQSAEAEKEDKTAKKATGKKHEK